MHALVAAIDVPAHFRSAVAWLPPAALATGIIGAALLLALKSAPTRLATAIALAASATATALDAVVLAATVHGRVVTWSAGWYPHHGLSVGIVLVSDPVGAGAAVVAGALTTVALVFGWSYMATVRSHYRPLVLLFMTGMTGFAFSGDIFDMLVFFELMGASSYALASLKVEDPSALQGGLNFALVNSLGAYIALFGITMLYAMTGGDLGLPQLGDAMAGHKPDALMVTAFVLIMCGFLVKAAVTPFHFWLADAHAVAPPAVCVLFSGIMAPLGVYGAFRVYWVVFSPAIRTGDVRGAFLVLGVLTAGVGAVMCLAQRHIKRLLSYATIAHIGLFTVAMALLGQKPTAGALVYVAGYAGTIAALFMLSGLLLANFASVDEHDLYGRCRHVTRWVPALWLVAALSMACLPPFGTALGSGLSEAAAISHRYYWLVAVFVLVAGATAGAVARVVARVYFGYGPQPSERAGESETRGDEEQDTDRLGLPASALGAIAVVLAGALCVGALPGARAASEHAAAFFTRAANYRQSALYGRHLGASAPVSANWDGTDIGLGLATVVVAAGFAAGGLYSRRLLAWSGRMGPVATRSLSALRRLHSGHIGDYVMWQFVGIALLLVMVGSTVLGR